MGGRVAQRAPARPAAGASDDEVGRRFPVWIEYYQVSVHLTGTNRPRGSLGAGTITLSPALSLKGEGAERHIRR